MQKRTSARGCSGDVSLQSSRLGNGPEAEQSYIGFPLELSQSPPTPKPAERQSPFASPHRLLVARSHMKAIRQAERPWHTPSSRPSLLLPERLAKPLTAGEVGFHDGRLGSELSLLARQTPSPDFPGNVLRRLAAINAIYTPDKRAVCCRHQLCCLSLRPTNLCVANRGGEGHGGEGVGESNVGPRHRAEGEGAYAEVGLVAVLAVDVSARARKGQVEEDGALGTAQVQQRSQHPWSALAREVVHEEVCEHHVEAAVWSMGSLLDLHTSLRIEDVRDEESPFVVIAEGAVSLLDGSIIMVSIHYMLGSNSRRRGRWGPLTSSP